MRNIRVTPKKITLVNTLSLGLFDAKHMLERRKTAPPKTHISRQLVMSAYAEKLVTQLSKLNTCFPPCKFQINN